MLGRPTIRVREADVEDSETLAELHAAAFRRGWSEPEVEALLRQTGVSALLGEYRGTFGRSIVAGFCLLRSSGEEAEILSIGILPACRRRGIARALMEEVLRRLYRDGVAALLLEVDAGNEAALALYGGLGFEPVGERPAYYSQGLDRPRGALVMRREVR
ncbi:MAG TPA: N-acetyltransferase, partial [Afifellaceae bacterium]|nr:N-acetyltransferase [Afifellaceae bacterium]